MTRRSLAALLAIVGLATPVEARQHEPDQAAMDALREVVEAYRKRPALEVRSTVKVEVGEGDMAGRGGEVVCEITLGRRPEAVVKLRDFTVYLSGGSITATHVTNDHAYFSTSDGGDPYYALMSAFIDVPFPHFAIHWGWEGMENFCMQFHPKAPDVVPTSVEDVTVDGRTLRRIMMTSETERMAVDVDPETLLLAHVDLRIAGGPLVPEGATMRYVHDFEYTQHDAPLPPETFRLEPGTRQHSDMLLAIVEQPRIDEEAGGGLGPAPAAPEPLVGRPAPPFVLGTLEGGAIDLADLEGRVVVLDFWATWCPPCRKALPQLHEVAAWAEREQLPVTIVTVNVWETQPGPDNTPDNRLKAAKAFWEANGFTLPVAMDFTDETGEAYQVNGIPTTVIIRADGVVHSQHSGVPQSSPSAYSDLLKVEIAGAIDALRDS